MTHAELPCKVAQLSVIGASHSSFCKENESSIIEKANWTAQHMFYGGGEKIESGPDVI
jgi:hypothetical protein